MSEPFIGEIRTVAFGFAPRDFSLCDGQLLAVNDNQALYSLLGTTFGGDGRSTFAVPDLRGRIPVHQGGAMQSGMKGGVERVSLATDQLPSHTHVLHVSSNTGSATSPAGGVPATADGNQNLYADPASGGSKLQPTDNQGGGQSHHNMQPSLAINFVIALQGIYPSRP